MTDYTFTLTTSTQTWTIVLWELPMHAREFRVYRQRAEGQRIEQTHYMYSRDAAFRRVFRLARQCVYEEAT